MMKILSHVLSNCKMEAYNVWSLSAGAYVGDTTHMLAQTPTKAR